MHIDSISNEKCMIYKIKTKLTMWNIDNTLEHSRYTDGSKSFSFYFSIKKTECNKPNLTKKSNLQKRKEKGYLVLYLSFILEKCLRVLV